MRRENRKFSETEIDGEVVHKENETSEKFPGYGSIYRTNFGRMCKYLISDNQVLRWNNAIEKYQKEKDSCIPCRQLYRVLKCKLPVQVTPVPKTTASSPATEMLAVVSESFQDIASDSRLVGQTVEALLPVLQELALPADPVTEAYYATLLTYIKTPLADLLSDAEQKMAEEKKKIKRKQLDVLF